MKIVIFGLSITSSWGNGHATTYRALTKALHARGHRIIFFEKDLYWYADNRDLPRPDFCDVRIFRSWKKALPEIKRELANADVAVIGSGMGGGDASQKAISDAAIAAQPGWYGAWTTVAGIVDLLGAVAIIVLLALPAANAYFRKAAPEWQPPAEELPPPVQ